jgi:hypothetical protein
MASLAEQQLRRKRTATRLAASGCWKNLDVDCAVKRLGTAEADVVFVACACAGGRGWLMAYRSLLGCGSKGTLPQGAAKVRALGWRGPRTYCSSRVVPRSAC